MMPLMPTTDRLICVWLFSLSSLAISTETYISLGISFQLRHRRSSPLQGQPHPDLSKQLKFLSRRCPSWQLNPAEIYRLAAQPLVNQGCCFQETFLSSGHGYAPLLRSSIVIDCPPVLLPGVLPRFRTCGQFSGLRRLHWRHVTTRSPLSESGRSGGARLLYFSNIRDAVGIL